MFLVAMSGTSVTGRAYASFARRLQALTIDLVIVTFAFVAIAMLGDFARNVPGSGRVVVVAIYALLFLYEPVLVWRFGATLGHRAANLRIVDDVSDGPPTFWRSCARFAVKAVLGLYSFATMAFTRRHQAIHDMLTHTTVQIRDLGVAAPGDYHPERSRRHGVEEQPLLDVPRVGGATELPSGGLTGGKDSPVGQ